MKKQFLFLLSFIVWYIFSTGNSFAARNINISSDKTSLVNGEEMNISASSSGFTNGEKIYVKGAFYKDGSSNYFGFTKNNESWIKNSTTALSQREIIIDSWDNNLIVKPDFLDNGFTGIGNYKFRLGFYYLTSSGNLSSINWSSNELNINIDSAPSQVPSVTKTKIYSNSTSSSSTSTNTNKTPTLTKIPIVSASKLNNLAISSKTTKEFAKITHVAKSASEFAKIKPITKEESKTEVKVLGAKKSNFAPLLFLSGLLFLLAGISFFAIKFLKQRQIL